MATFTSTAPMAWTSSRARRWWSPGGDVQEPAARDDADHADVPVERLGRHRRAELCDRKRRSRSDLQPGHRGGDSEKGDGPMAASDPGADEGAPSRDRGPGRLEADRGDVGEGSQAPRAGVCGAPRA